MALSGEVVGVALAAAAAVSFEVSYVVQALEARRVAPADTAHPRLLAQLAARPAWLAALVLSLVAFGLQVLALRHVALSVAQPVLAAGLVVLLALSRLVLGERVGRREVVAAAGVIAGVTLLVVAMPTRTGAHHTGGLLVACAALAVVTLAPFARRSVAPGLLIAAATAGDALAALSANEVARSLAPVGLAALAWAALAALAGVLVLISETTALQRTPASTVASIVLAGQVAVPVVLAPLLAGDDWSSTPEGGAVVVVGLVLVVASVALLGRSPAIGRVLHPDAT